MNRNKVIQAVLTGLFVAFILDFFFFLGIFINYINFHNIDVYYNTLFADHQNGYIFFLLTLMFGYMIIYIKNHKLSLITVSLLSFVTLLTLFEDIGQRVGESMFMTKNTTLKSSRYSYIGDILYDGRTHITFYDYELKRVIKLNKKELKN